MLSPDKWRPLGIMTAGCTLQFLDFRQRGVAAGCAGGDLNPEDAMSEKL